MSRSRSSITSEPANAPLITPPGGRANAFDRKFGAAFLAGVPAAPGIYRFLEAGGAVLYVGKAKNLRRRLAEYRRAGPSRPHRKMRRIVREAARLEWDAKATHLDACLDEVRWIQTARPPRNVASAFPFLYPLIGLRALPDLACFCFTTVPDAFPAYDFHGAFRSRDVTGAGFFALMRLLHYVGHRSPRKALGADAARDYSYVFGFRQLPTAWRQPWDAFFRGESPEALTALVLELLEHTAARRRAAEVQEDLALLKLFWTAEARPLRAAIEATSHAAYPVAQRERDLIFLRYREAGRA